MQIFSRRGRRIAALIVPLLGFIGLSNTSQAAPVAITNGDLVVLRVGDGTTAATGNALPVTLDEYSVTYTGALPTSVALVQSIPVSSTVTSSGNRALTQGGTAGGEGGLLLSGNGRYLTFAGYNAAPGSQASGSATPNRVIGRLDLSTGNVDTSTALTDASGSSNAARGAYSTDGTHFYLAGSSGPRYVASLGATTSTLLATTANMRRMLVNNGQLYATEGANSREGVETIGAGTPTTSGQTVTLLPGFPTASESPYDFFFANSTTIYEADDGTVGSGQGGLQKWVFNGTTWTRDYIDPINGGTGGIKGLTGFVDGSGNVTMFATTVGPNGNFMFGLSDTLSNSSAANVSSQQLVNASTFFGGGTDWNLRGLAIAPEPTSLGLMALWLPAMFRRRRHA